MDTIKLRPVLVNPEAPSWGRLDVPYPPEHPGRTLDKDGEVFTLPLASWWQRRLNFGEVEVVAKRASQTPQADPQA